MIGYGLALLVLSTYSVSQQSQQNTSNPVQSMQQYQCQTQYKPFSNEAKNLFNEVASQAGVPGSWAYSPGLHAILKKESNGMVGIPNYTIKDAEGKTVRNNQEAWPEIHQKIRDNQYLAPSHATGLGQLQPQYVDRFYPSGRNGIGDCREEAIGMLRYIKAAYGTPERAWNCYGKFKPKACPKKRFREGY